MRIVIGVVLLIGCQRDPARHFVDTEGNAHPEFEPAWDAVERAVGAAPASITVELTDDGISRFDGKTRRLLIDRANLARRSNELVGHELTHVALYAKTDGASAEEPFRFLDEGFANIVGARLANNLDDYKTKAIATTRTKIADEHIGLAEMQHWSVFFGGPKSGRWWAYEVGSTFCFMILDRYGDAALRRLFDQLAGSHDLATALRSTFGLSYAEAEQQWVRYVGAT